MRRKILAALFVFLPSAAFAGSPYQTDDPGFPERWEINTGFVYARDSMRRTAIGPFFDIGYGFDDDVQVTLVGGVGWGRGDRRGFGSADTTANAKVTLLVDDENSDMPGLSVAPALTLPTGVGRNGLGDRAWKFFLPFEIGKKFGPVYVYGEAGYLYAARRGVGDSIPIGAVAEVTLSEILTVGFEVTTALALARGERDQLAANTGFVWKLRDGVALTGLIGRSLRSTERLPGPSLQSALLLNLTF